MAILRLRVSPNALLFIGFAVVFGFCLCRVHMRVQTTLIGYELGKLKAQESELLAKRAQLQMQYATVTTKENLYNLANLNSGKSSIASVAEIH